MKPSRIVLLCLVLMLMVACTINTAGVGLINNGKLLSQPLTGLDKLTHYKASLNVSTQEQTSSGAVDRNEQYALSVWTAEAAIFETIDSVDDANQPIKVTLGKVGQAGYMLWGGETGCQVVWAPTNMPVDTTSLAPYLYALKSGTPAGDETVAGIATHAYRLNSDSIAIQGIQADGEIWLAASGGYLVKYHLVLTGDKALFGADGQGTRTIDYALSEINDGTAVTYPGDCLPVLTDIPAMQDAQDVERLPDDLHFTSASSTDQLKAFYEKYFTGQGWDKLSEDTLPSGEVDILYFQKATGRDADVVLQAQAGTTTVDVLSSSSETEQASSSTQTPNPNITPTSGPTADTSSLNLPKGLTVYPGATSLDTSGLTSGMAGSKYVIFHTSASPAQVIAYYHQTLEQAGWTATPIATPSATSDHAMGMWYTGTYTLTISASTKSGDTQVQVGWLGD